MAEAQRECEPRTSAGAGLPEEGGLVGIDIGGGGVRVGYFAPPDSLRHLISWPELTAIESFDPEATWLTVASAIRELTSRGLRIRAIGLTAHLATVLADRDGRPTTEALLWRDTQAQQEAQEIHDALGAGLESITGRRSSAESPAARIRRLARVSPAVLGRTRWLLSLKDYLIMKLTGQVSTDPTSASYTQLFDVRRRRWSPEIARKCGVPLHILPPVRPATAMAGRISLAAAELTGLLQATPVAVGCPDGSAGGLGVGAYHAGITFDIAGTTDVLLHVTDAPMDCARHGAVLNAYVMEPFWAAGGPTGLTGGGIDWLTATLGYPSTGAAYKDLEPHLAAADPGDLLMRTTLTGRRLPGWDSLARGRIDGISAADGPIQLVRAAEDGAVFEVRLGIDALRAIGASVTTVITAGGPSDSPRLVQLRADAWAAQVGTSADSHATLRGAALAGAVAAGCFPDAVAAAAAMVPPLQWYRPEPTAARNAELRYRRWRAVMTGS
jgi:xylulokinase